MTAREERVEVLRRRLARRHAVADAIEAAGDESKAAARPSGVSDAGRGHPIPRPDRGVPLWQLARQARARWGDL